MALVKIYRFEDSKTGETFEGTRDEYAFHLGVTRPAVDSRIHTGRASATVVGKKENGAGNVRNVFTEVATGREFFGYYKEATEYFDIPYVRLKNTLLKGLSLLNHLLRQLESQEIAGMLFLTKKQNRNVAYSVY